MHVTCVCVATACNEQKSVQHSLPPNNRAMDVVPAVSTLHTLSGSKAWSSGSKDQEKRREYGGEEKNRDNRQTAEQMKIEEGENI